MKTIVSALIAATLACVPGFAQGGPTGQMSGRVTDTTGAVLPGVDVTATQKDTGLVRSVVTNEAGAYSGLDASVSRVFKLKERHQFELRAEAFNLPNAVRPLNPSTSLTNPNFGEIISVDSPRIM